LGADCGSLPASSHLIKNFGSGVLKLVLLHNFEFVVVIEEIAIAFFLCPKQRHHLHGGSGSFIRSPCR
jgi:hypothetical protein